MFVGYAITIPLHVLACGTRKEAVGSFVASPSPLCHAHAHKSSISCGAYELGGRTLHYIVFARGMLSFAACALARRNSRVCQAISPAHVYVILINSLLWMQCITPSSIICWSLPTAITYGGVWVTDL